MEGATGSGWVDPLACSPMAGCCWMVSQHLLLSTPPNHVPLNFSSALISSTPLSFSLGSGSRSRVRGRASARARARATRTSNALSVSASSTLQALIFDCDGVILESEDLHRRAYNDAFSHFNVRCPSSPSQHPLNWDSHFYDQLQNRIGGGKPKMRWFSSFSFQLSLSWFSVYVLICRAFIWLGTLRSTAGLRPPSLTPPRRMMAIEPSWSIFFRFLFLIPLKI